MPRNMYDHTDDDFPELEAIVEVAVEVEPQRRVTLLQKAVEELLVELYELQEGDFKTSRAAQIKYLEDRLKRAY